LISNCKAGAYTDDYGTKDDVDENLIAKVSKKCIIIITVHHQSSSQCIIIIITVHHHYHSALPKTILMRTLSPRYPRRGANAKAAIGVIPPLGRIFFSASIYICILVML